MSSKFDSFFRALKADGEDQLVCQECEEQLSEYVVAVLNDEAHTAQWAAIRLHLEQCPSCMAAYDDLLELVQLAAGEQQTLVTNYPQPDLTFLRSADTSPSFWRINELGRLIVDFSTDLLRSLTLSPQQMSLAGAGLKAAGPVPLIQPITIAEAGSDLEVVISAETVRDQPEQALVIVEVRIPSRGGWPNLTGSRVTLHRKGPTVETQITDAFGKATFSGIAIKELEQLRVEVDPLRGPTE